MYHDYGKTGMDLFLAIILFLLCLPLFIFISLCIFIFMGRPIFFKQPRPGLNQKIFYIYKFRTMKNISKNNHQLNDYARISSLGKLLRNWSLDELPELINILRGEMSFVGPRPLLVEYLPYYNKEQQLRHTVKPGITGWAQIKGRNHLSWEDKFSLDIWYVKNMSFLLDLKIIILTFFKVLKREGINAQAEVTMSRFDLETKASLHDKEKL